jgi:NAD(P)-dependent dehydrogenase (short-subunit alcohol dehydrogenase family)
MNDLDLSEQLIVISGAAGGLGRHICRRLAGLGADVVAVDIVEEEAPWGQDGPEGAIWCYQADVAASDAVEELLGAVEAKYGRTATTVCCHAGMVDAHDILSVPPEAFYALFRANVMSAFVLAQGAAARWRATGSAGHLIFTSSWVQDYPWPGIAAYCACKAAVHALMRSFAKELSEFGIRANAVLPGIVGVGMGRRQWDEDPAYRRRAQSAIALGTLQDAESVADAFAFLCSPLASYMTGSSLTVDGGCSLIGTA